MATVFTGAGFRAFLADMPLMSMAEDAALDELVASLQSIHFSYGDVVRRIGDDEGGLDIVLSGRIHVVDGNGDRERVVDTLTRGDYFGEDTLYEPTPFSFTYRAAGDATVLRMTAVEFSEWLRRHPSLLQVVESHLADGAMRNFIRRCTVFSPFTGGEMARFLAVFRPVAVPAGTDVVRQGDGGDAFYLVREGQMEVVQRSHDDSNDGVGEEKSLGTIGPGQFFGELALLTDQPRAATVTALSPARLFRVSKDDFRRILRDVPQVHEAILGVAAGYSEDAKEMLLLSEPIGTERKGTMVGSPGDAFTYESIGRWPRRPVPMLRTELKADSGAACLAMVGRFYGLHLELSDIRQKAHITRYGGTMYGLAEAAEQLGLQGTGIRYRREELEAARTGGDAPRPLDDVALPAIAQMKDDGFVVLYAASGDRIAVADPRTRTSWVRRKDFLDEWSGTLLSLGVAPKVDEEKASHSLFARYVPVVLTQRGALWRAFFASIVVQLFGLAIPLFTQRIVDQVVVNEDVGLLNLLLVGMLLAAGGRAVTEYFRQYVLVRAVRHIDTVLLVQFFRHLFGLPIRYFQDRKIGDILARIDANEKVRSLLTVVTLAVLLDAMTVAVYGTLMMTYSVKLTLVAAAFVPLFVLVIVGFLPLMRRFRRGAFLTATEMKSAVVEAVTGVETVKATAAEQPIRWNWEQLMRRHVSFSQSASLVAVGAESLAQFLQVGASAVLLWYGANLVMDGELTVGQLMAFNVLVGTAIVPLLRLVNSWTDFQQGRVAAERMEDVYGSEPELATDGKGIMPPLRGAIRFENVSFRYTEDGRNVLRNIDVDIRPGQTVALLGRSGSGKSTLMNLLLRLYEPTEGRVLVDGVDVKEVTRASLRRQIGVVLQDNFLFNGTIRDNIALNDSSPSMQGVITAAMLAGAHEFISELSGGYDTVVGPRGVSLSGGQMQRLAIARALYLKPRILVLDEATSALDPESERIIQQNLERILHDRTTFIIAHRLSTVRHADIILVLDDGVIVERGTHEQLMARRGLYHHLSRQQLQAS